MKSLILACGLVLSNLLVVSASTIVTMPLSSNPKLPSKIGYAGMAAAIQSSGGPHGASVLLYAGGANFPFAQEGATTPEQRGPKVFHNVVGMMATAMDCADCGTPPTFIGKLPYKVAYPSYVGDKDGLIIAGGCNADSHLSKTTLITYQYGRIKCQPLADLPVPSAYAAFAKVGNKFYVFGGQEKTNSTTCLAKSYVLNLDNPNKGWVALPDMPSARMLAGAAVYQDRIYIMGGCWLTPDAKGAAQRTYLVDTIVFDSTTQKWLSVTDQSIPAMPESIAAAPNPLPVIDGKAYVMGGDAGNTYRAGLLGKAPTVHPGQSTTIYCYDFAKKSWSVAGKTSIGICTAPAVQLGNTAPTSIITISGEIFPGVRTPSIGISEIK